MKRNTENVQTVVLPQQSMATKKNISKLKIYLSENGNTRQEIKKLGK